MSKRRNGAALTMAQTVMFKEEPMETERKPPDPRAPRMMWFMGERALIWYVGEHGGTRSPLWAIGFLDTEGYGEPFGCLYLTRDDAERAVRLALAVKTWDGRTFDAPAVLESRSDRDFFRKWARGAALSNLRVERKILLDRLSELGIDALSLGA